MPFIYYLIVYVNYARYCIYYRVYYSPYYNLYYSVYKYVYKYVYYRVYNRPIRLIFKLLTIYRVTKPTEPINSKYYLLKVMYLDPRFTNPTNPYISI